MRSVNKAIIAGHLGKDPEVRYLTDGKAVASFSIATTEKWKDKNGQQQEKTEWHNITAFGRLGEIAGEYLRKGAAVYVEGKITTEKWTDKEGKDRYTTKIIASEMQMLGGKGERAGETKPAQAAPEPGKSFDDFDDEVPF